MVVGRGGKGVTAGRKNSGKTKEVLSLFYRQVHLLIEKNLITTFFSFLPFSERELSRAGRGRESRRGEIG